MAWPRRNGRTWTQAVPGFDHEITFTEDVDALDVIMVATAFTGAANTDPNALGRLMARAVREPKLLAEDFAQMPLAHQVALVNAFFEKVNLQNLVAHGKS